MGVHDRPDFQETGVGKILLEQQDLMDRGPAQVQFPFLRFELLRGCGDRNPGRLDQVVVPGGIEMFQAVGVLPVEFARCNARQRIRIGTSTPRS